MIAITVLPHPELCPKGAVFAATPGHTLCEALLSAGIEIEHACEQACACSTCHVILRKGFDLLPPPGEDEEDMLDCAFGLTPTSRLACQVVLEEGMSLTIEIPRYSRNLVKERS
ncbi:MAG: ISC system 2Fe-2S type ferredoxin [Methylohalobius sp.]|nr:ISC system 2Fe-2S type ferredoxin [Methylohalobius sp.]